MAQLKSTVQKSDFPSDMRRPGSSGLDLELGHDLVEYLKEYAREKPEIVALWCFGIGFILGWKLKPW